jgi:hypothetical protein
VDQRGIHVNSTSVNNVGLDEVFHKVDVIQDTKQAKMGQRDIVYGVNNIVLHTGDT